MTKPARPGDTMTRISSPHFRQSPRPRITGAAKAALTLVAVLTITGCQSLGRPMAPTTGAGASSAAPVSSPPPAPQFVPTSQPVAYYSAGGPSVTLAQPAAESAAAGGAVLAQKNTSGNAGYDYQGEYTPPTGRPRRPGRPYQLPGRIAGSRSGTGAMSPVGLPEADVICGPNDEQGYWQPDGLAGPWPYDEYIFDGGDRDVPVDVAKNWNVRGLDQEDTVAHFDTIRGRTEVVPSNRVPIYAPRFAAVRKVTGLDLHEGHERVAGTENPTRLNSQETTQLVTTTVQQNPPVLQHNLRSSVALLDRTRGIGVDNSTQLLGFDNKYLPFEDFRLIRRGEFDNTEKARLAQRIQAALTWSSDQMVQVVIDGDLAVEAKGISKSQETIEYHRPEGQPRLRIVKVASKSEARPGEVIDFTLRFDNIGDERIGNVTIVDSLTTRLEFIEGSAQCSLASQFGTQENEAESVVLRWEIRDPLEVGQGGIIRFRCRLR
ncbi:MAG: hypothetical protein ACKOBW_13170 [Planctomycetota bacterium]